MEWTWCKIEIEYKRYTYDFHPSLQWIFIGISISPPLFSIYVLKWLRKMCALVCVVHLIFVINFSLKTLHTVFVNVRGSLMWYKKKKIFAQRFRWLCEYVSQPGVPSFVYALYTYNRLNAVLYSAESDSPLWKSERKKKFLKTQLRYRKKW